MEVSEKLNSYPSAVLIKINEMRDLILEVAGEISSEPVEESIKWGELSYSRKGGSPIRMDWKPKDPDYYFLYFHCQTKLVETFREVYGSKFEYVGKRAIKLALSGEIPVPEVRHCIALALKYHSVKNQPLLGC